MITVRKMEPSEAQEVKRIAKRAFAVGIERFFVSNPKEAMVAVVDDKIVGGIIIKYHQYAGSKIGYFDAAFVDPAYHGKGIGSILYEKTTEYLWEQGCTVLSAIVKDDNVGSWKLFLNNGFNRSSLIEAVRQLGLWATILHYFTTPLFASNGMELYLAVKNVDVKSKNSGSMAQIGLYLLANALLFLFSLFSHPQDFPLYFAAYLTLLAGGVVFGYVGTLFSKKQWRYRLNSGGAAMVAFISFIGGVYPMIGNWYPKKYENVKELKKDMGVTALCEWIFILVVTAIAFLLQPTYIFCKCLAYMGSVFLLNKIITFYPFESYGGQRVYQWNKAVYVVLTVVSALLIVFINYVS